MRTTDQDPFLIPATIKLLCISAKSTKADSGIDLINIYFDKMRNRTYDLMHQTEDDSAMILANAKLFMDVAGPVPSSNYSSLAFWTQKLEDAKAALADETTDAQTRKEYEAAMAGSDNRASLEECVQYAADNQYTFTVEELAAYREIVPYFYFFSPSGFDTASDDVKKLQKQFASGKLTAEEFATQMDTLAQQ